MKHIDIARGTALNYFKARDELTQKIADIDEKYKKYEITGKVRNEQIAVIDENMRNLLCDFSEVIARLKIKYDEAVDKWSKLDGKNMPDDDIKLLSGVIALNSDDLANLSLKHKNNITMQRALNEYAAKHNINYNKTTPLPKDMKAGYASLCNTILRAANSTNNLHRAFIEDSVQFENTLSPALKFDVDIG